MSPTPTHFKIFPVVVKCLGWFAGWLGCCCGAVWGGAKAIPVCSQPVRLYAPGSLGTNRKSTNSPAKRGDAIPTKSEARHTAINF
jgi:hypothetical protein